MASQLPTWNDTNVLDFLQENQMILVTHLHINAREYSQLINDFNLEVTVLRKK